MQCVNKDLSVFCLDSDIVVPVSGSPSIKIFSKATDVVELLSWTGFLYYMDLLGE